MKLLVLALLLIAVFAAVEAADVVECLPVEASCRRVPQATRKMCSSIITARRIPLTYCQYPKSTVTSTTTSSRTTTKTSTIRAKTTTRTVTSTSTIRGPTVSPAPTTVSVTSTTTVQSTTVSTSQTVTTTTTTSVSSFTATTSTTVTHWSQTRPSWTQETCTSTKQIFTKRDLWDVVHDFVARHPKTAEAIDLYAEFMHGQQDDGLSYRASPEHLFERDTPDFPEDCSCFLTSTKLDPKPDTTTTTFTRRFTEISTTIIGGTAPTVTKTSTARRTTSLPGVTFPRRTSTSTVTSTTTQVVTTTTISTSVSTTVFTTSSTSTSVSTSITTTINTIYSAPCSAGEFGRSVIDGQLSNGYVIELPGRQAPAGNTGVEEYCCNDCFYSSNCAYWYRDFDTGYCVRGIILPSYPKECDTEHCSNGLVTLQKGDPNPSREYHPGNCGPRVQAVTTV